MLSLSAGLSQYYCCSLGQAVAATLPEALRKGKKISFEASTRQNSCGGSFSVRLVQGLPDAAKRAFILEEVKGALKNHKTAIIILRDKEAVLAYKDFMAANLKEPLSAVHRKQKQETEEWLKIKTGKASVVIGTRSAVFAPLNNPGLIIIDDEEDSVYKQEQVPHYQARDVAIMRAKNEEANLLLFSHGPCLESYYQAKLQRFKYQNFLKSDNLPAVKIIDLNRLRQFKGRGILSKYLQDALAANLESNRKSLLFLNRKGFATFCFCSNCAKTLRCPRCNVNLVYYFHEKKLRCHYCAFKTDLPDICPHCHLGYLKLGGMGIEKVENELSRIFPSARIARCESSFGEGAKEADIFIATSRILRGPALKFDLVGVLGIDNVLNRIDFRAGEKAFTLLCALLQLTQGQMVIETNLPLHHAFRALAEKDIESFYEEELKQRRQLQFPPYSHFILVKLRSGDEERVERASRNLFERLCGQNRSKDIIIISVNPGNPAKVRGNFIRQILIRAPGPTAAGKFLKKCLKDFPHSDIIVTVDVDPL
jgi:primosomal protein N' (replication factor Y)